MKNLTRTPNHRFLLGLLTVCMLSQPAWAGVKIISSEEVSVQKGFTSEELAEFRGDWHLERSEVVFVIKSVNPEGKSDVGVISEDALTVKRVVLSRFIGSMPLLTIETQYDGKPHGVFCLMSENGKLVGTYDDIASGRSVDVSLTRKKPVKLSAN